MNPPNRCHHLLASLALTTCLATQALAAEDIQYGWTAIQPYVRRYQALSKSESPSRLIYELLGKIESRQIRLETRSDADSLATFLSVFLTPYTDPSVCNRAVEFFAAHPHPAAADSLWNLIETKDQVVSNTLGAPVWILADLGDRRVVPFLIRGTLAGRDEDFDRLAPLADESVTVELQAIAADTAMEPVVRRRAAETIERLADWRRHPLVNAAGIPANRRERLIRDGFSVSPGGENEMFELYGPEYPFVTTDVVWHTWMILIRAARTEMEDLLLDPLVAEFGRGLATSGSEADTVQLVDLALGRKSLRLDNEMDMRRLVEVVALFEEQTDLARRWQEMDRLLGNLFGPPDDLTLADCTTAARAVAGEAFGQVSPTSIRRMATEPARMKQFRNRLLMQPGARIATDPSPASDGRRRGLRLLGQRYTRPIALLQHQMESSGWPPRALDLVDAIRGEASSTESPSEIRLDPPPPGAPGSVSEGLIACAREILATPPPAAPRFMANPAWRQKEANWVLGAWAEMQNLSADYVKDANTYQSISKDTDDIHGYVEPVPRFYARLDSLNRHAMAQFDSIGLWRRIDEDKQFRLANPSTYANADRYRERNIRVARTDFEEFSVLLARLERIAVGELRGEPQSIDDGYFLKSFYRQIMRLSFQRSNANVAQVPMSVVATVANEHQSQVSLQLAVGQPWRIEVLVPDRGRAIVCRGAIYSSYEFTTPMDRRYDEEEWRIQSRLSDPADRLPWLAQPGRVGAWTLTAADLDSMRVEKRARSLRLMGSAAPNRWTPLRASTLEPFDPEALLAVVEAPACGEEARELALVRLADDGTDPRVREALTRRIEAPLRAGDDFDAADILLSLRGLGSCGREAVPVLEAARARTFSFRQWRDDVFHRQIDRSLGRIEAWPKGYRVGQ